MAVRLDSSTGIIQIDTRNTTYQMQTDRYGYLLHLYYGRRITGSAAQVLTYADRGFSGNPNDAGKDRTYSLDQLPQELPFAGSADFRTPAFCMRNADGSHGCDLRFETLRVRDGKYSLEGLPSSYADDPGDAGSNAVQTLEIVLKDKVSGVRVHLLYGVFEEEDVITRAVVTENTGEDEVVLEKAASASMDFAYGDYETLTFYGRHAMERNVEKTRIGHGRYEVGSRRGCSSHQYNPFVILKAPETTETVGDAYGMHLVYSGNFVMSAERDQYDSTRWMMGLLDEDFSWTIQPGESFTSPEVIMAYSPDGLGSLSVILHRFIREHIIRGPWKSRRRPVLINNWEATYFDFNAEKLEKIAQQAASLGVEMMVLDDGWFGKRDSDESGLGDWQVNLTKLGGTMADLAKKINALGMKFGLWFEPEAVSEDSDLFREHPDWALRIPGRPYSRSRYQLVLDFSRKEVVDRIFQDMCKVLDNADISYIKWDMNRHLTDVYDPTLPPEQQGEVAHRYVLGVYDLLERLQERYPDLLMEGCSGGGGRFDTGMLCYTPQIWCSDNTDAADRCLIQYGTSFGYPVSAMGAHVSAVPNEQSGRTTPFHTRAVVASAGSFGYELDLNKITPQEREEVKAQIQEFKDDYETVHHGDYYRLSDPVKEEFSSWMTVSGDRKSAVVFAVLLEAHANGLFHFIRLRGLDPAATYVVRETGKAYTGSSLMYAGIPLPQGRQYDAWKFHLEVKD